MRQWLRALLWPLLYVMGSAEGTMESLGVGTYTWDFEDGTMNGFVRESGDCGFQPRRYVGSGDDRWNPGKPAGAGTYFVDTHWRETKEDFRSEDRQTCDYRDRAHNFVVGPETAIEWYHSASNSVYLMELETDKVLKHLSGLNRTFVMQRASWSPADLVRARRKTVYLRFTDHGKQSWNHIQLDNLRVSGALRLQVNGTSCAAHCAQDEMKGVITGGGSLGVCIGTCAGWAMCEFGGGCVDAPTDWTDYGDPCYKSGKKVCCCQDPAPLLGFLDVAGGSTPGLLASLTLGLPVIAALLAA
mmetsp:Transcript_136850/g.381472  ORF Transcript_136850/g.381472 Transcript_136850/m.381472 type:complete len:300 (-) Transcript_136850:84-983(-)